VTDEAPIVVEPTSRRLRELVARDMEHVVLRWLRSTSISLLASVVLIVSIAIAFGEWFGGVACVVLVILVLATRFHIIWRYNRDPGSRSVERFVYEIEASALLAGLLWFTAGAFIIPNVPTQWADVILLVLAGAIASAAFFFALVGRSFLILIVCIVSGIVVGEASNMHWSEGASVDNVHSLGVVVLTCIFVSLMTIAAKELRRVTYLSIQRGIEAEVANAALVKAKDQAEAASVAKSSFLANMSHEIRTPMNGVLGSLELLGQGELSTTQRELLDTAASSGESLLSILNEVLDFTKLEAGKVRVLNETFNIHALASSAMALFSAGAKRKSLDLQLAIDPGLPHQLIGDASRLRQVLLNLIGNSVKFTEAGTINVSIRRGPRTAEQAALPVLFEVQDTGIGIPPEALPELFSPFFQADQSSRRRHAGTGLGLAISKRLVEAMGGVLSVTSEVGKGAMFGFCVMLEVDHQQPMVEASAQLEAAVPLLSGRILLVEDNEINRLIAQQMLAAFGLEVDQAVNGEDALRSISGQVYQLVLMDCQMPVMDGFAAAREIRRLENASESITVPIVAVTANALSGDAERCFDAGMDAYLAKPYTSAQLRSAVEPWLQHQVRD
jgi:signal transduction histidine kinase/CheY-like chemotaxis protein